MNIILTQKDADWMANIIRDRMKDLKTAYDEALQEGNNRYDFCKKLADTIGLDPESDDSGKPLSQVKAEAEYNAKKEFVERMEEYEKMIYLLIAGSD